jgi:3-hydroxyisobutyrate dehydrogenase-like beta-hydroxyacid dehydrogenase
MRIAVLGLGAMGHAIAIRLLEGGNQVKVWNRTASRGEDLVQRGAERASTPADAARGVDVAIVSLSDDGAVRGAVLGDGGVIHGLGAEAVLVNMSTVSPETTRELARALGGRLVDAPILGGPAAIAGRQATILLAGHDQFGNQLSPLFDELSARQIRCGAVGAASTVKIVANLLLLGQLTVLSEAVAAAQANGVGDEILTELGRSPLVAPALQNRLEDVIRGDHKGWFSVRLGHKDVRLARSLAAGAGLDLAVAAAVDALFDSAEAAGLGDHDIAAVVEAVRGRRLAQPATTV